jgi:hypothetical protein
VLTVLDFIGQHRKEFRLDLRYRALTGTSRRGLQCQIEQGFPFLPAGSQVVLDRVAQQTVLANVRNQLRFTRTQLIADVRSHGDLPLVAYLHAADRELVDVYRNNSSWTALRREAGRPAPAPGPGPGSGVRGPDEESLLRRTAAFAHVDDPERAQVYRRLVAGDGPRYDVLTAREQRLARMLLSPNWSPSASTGPGTFRRRSARDCSTSR